mmetsp:Transcript_25594/g.65045  ORF Transcript_25594/g.65045 Transcript_25594/m.65045 type:complete len:100 (-) Transcript_25594:25-324(-)
MLYHAGTMEEHFADSAFDGINSHCINNVFAYQLTPDEFRALQKPSQIRARIDRQHSESRWFNVHDAGLHLYIAEKLRLALDALDRQIGAQAIQQCFQAR